jgi:hypothetical protein
MIRPLPAQVQAPANAVRHVGQAAMDKDLVKVKVKFIHHNAHHVRTMPPGFFVVMQIKPFIKSKLPVINNNKTMPNRKEGCIVSVRRFYYYCLVDR